MKTHLFLRCYLALGVFLTLANMELLGQEIALKTPVAKLDLKDGDCIVFLGDSITAQCLYTQYLENYFYTRYPSIRLRLHNAGVSGDTIANALARFDRDVAYYKPKYVTVLLGMNDGAGQVFDNKLFDTFRTDMQRLTKRITEIGATPILITPTMYDAVAAKANTKPDSRGRGGYFNGILALYGSWLREFANEQGYGIVDLHGPLNQFTHQGRKTKPSFTLIPDGIHPDANGQILMAYALVSDLGLSRRVSTIDLVRKDDGEALAKVTGGKIESANYNSHGVEFTFLPTSLPMSVPEGAQKGAAMIPLGHRLSYEAITIHDLVSGTYQIAINDIVIGKYHSSVLESRIEIEDNELTPEYQQSRRVAELNAKRNVEAVVPLRDFWRAKKTLERTYAEQKQAPDDETLKKRIFAYERKLANFEGQLHVFDLKSQEFEDELYRVNQPQPLRFDIRKVD